MAEGFPPIAAADARILILGTMPSEASLQKGQYYGFPRNAFWPILFGLWGLEVPDAYEARCRFVCEKRIALWDVLGTCVREGSADAAIAQPQANDFARFARDCPGIRRVFFNSVNAQTFYRRLVRPDPFAGLPQQALPSTSPARAMPLARKQALWQPLYAAWAAECG